ncbi:MAG: SLBB domain-containing protein [Treponema sp.]|nr:SLBB domain-containing protein [Treponema sp.]
MKVYSFPRGGLSLEDPTVPPREPSITAFLPGLSVIPLVQHTGNRAYPVVSIGEYVKEGTLIGRGQGWGSANIHATVPGRIVRMVSWKMTEGRTNDALIIRLEGSFERLGKPEEQHPWEGLSPFDLQRLIADYGIVEMEGSGRPVSDILASFRSTPEPIALVVSCVFDDPWLVADYVLCRERLKAVVEGSAIISRTGRINRIVYAVSRKEKELGLMLLAEAEAWNIPCSLVLVDSRYPQHNRRELELVLRVYEKKEGLELGSLLILGPATLAAVHDAVKLRKPILDRYIAVGGSAVKRPRVLKARIGTRIGAVFAECGGFIDKPGRIAMGSPLSGRSVEDLDEPVVKTSFAVFALLKKQVGGLAARSCIGCGECRAVCPIGLDPEEIYKQITVTVPKGGFSTGGRAGECHGCGCCEVVCPSRLPLSSVIFTYGFRGN